MSLDVLPGRGILAIHWTPVPALDHEKGLSRQVDRGTVRRSGRRFSPGLARFPSLVPRTSGIGKNHRGDGTGFFIPNPPFQKSLVWSAWGELVLVAPTERYELRAYRHDGSLVRIVRRENDVRSPTEADLDSYRADRRRDAERWPPDARRLFLAALDALPLPESFPAISAIEVDLLGNLWVREYNLPGQDDRAVWTVFDPEGLALGFVETPPDLVIYEIGEDYILGKVLDDLRVEYVQLWRLDRVG